MGHLTLQFMLLYSTLALLSILGRTASQTTSKRLSNNPSVPYGAVSDYVEGETCERGRYRAIDGYCNNEDYPYWGVPQRPYAKFIKCVYTNATLPNAQQVSRTLFRDIPVLDPVWNLAAAFWGQLIAHDMSFTTGTTQSYPNPIQCCTADGQPTQAEQSNPRCKPIIVPKGDPDLPQGYCINFVKSIKGADKGYTGDEAGVALTAVTSFLDLSIVYGNSVAQSNSLRTFSDGLLKFETRANKVFPPKEPRTLEVCSNAETASEPCYLTGDLRSNQSLLLALLQIFYLRNHNRIARILKLLNPHWSDEIIFQETRRICIAEYNHINYYEWLVIFLGASKMQTEKLTYSGSTGYNNDYDETVNPTVLDEHATAAFRDLHTLIRGFLYLENEQRVLTESLRLSSHFNRPNILEYGNTMDSLCRGSTTESESKRDQWWTSEITKFLFRKLNETFGGDLRMADMQRSRDHYLCSYVAARRAFGLKPVKSFADLRAYISPENVALLEMFYKKIELVELVVAGSLEINAPGALVGPTFQAIMIKQFLNTRKGDSYYHENGANPKTRFTLDQLTQIRKATVAKFFCNNADNVTKMSKEGFKKTGLGNPLVRCDELPGMDLTKWTDKNRSGNEYPRYE